METSLNRRCNLMMGRWCLLGLPVLLAVAVLLILAACPSSISADDTGTNFFLKASKSVPRIGRRSEYDNYLKTPKNVPRIGRRSEMSPLIESREGSSWPWFRMADAVPGPSRRSEYYMHEEGEPLSWNSVDKMMEETPEMWKPDLWRRNGEVFPLKDDYDIQRVLRMSPGRFDSTKELDEGGSQAEI